MSVTLEKALGQVDLEPGATRVAVNGFAVRVEVLRQPTPPDPPPDDIAESMMVDAPWFPDIGPSFMVIATRGEPTPPDPIIIDDWEAEPE